MATNRPIDQEDMTLSDLVTIVILGHVAENSPRTSIQDPTEIVRTAYALADAYVAEKDRRNQS